MDEWPHLQAQTKAAVKKEKHLREKVLPDVRRKLSQVEKNLQPAVENTNMSNNATKEAKQRTQNVEKVCLFFSYLVMSFKQKNTFCVDYYSIF